MNAKERILACIKKESIDRVPVIPYISQFACVDQGVNYTEFCKNAEQLSDTLMLCREKYDYDALYISTDSCMEVEAMGCPVRYFENDVPTVCGNPWADKELANCIFERPDPATGGRMPVYQEAIRIMKEKTNDEYAIIAGSDGPLTIFSHFRGLTKLMMDVYDKPVECERLLLDAAQITIDFNVANLKAGATLCHFGDPEAALLGPEFYQQVVKKVHKKVVDGIHAEGGLVLGHFCGKTDSIMGDLVSLGFDVLNIDNQMGLEFAKQHAEKVCLLGDLHPIEILREGDEKKLSDSIKARMDLLKDTHHYMLGSGCHFPADTPPENVKYFVEYGKLYGNYTA